jgi:hypothetical protein
VRFTRGFFAPRPGSVVEGLVIFGFSRSEVFSDPGKKKSPCAWSDNKQGRYNPFSRYIYTERNSAMHDDKQFQEFVAAYPASRRSHSVSAHAAFVHALKWTPFETLLAALEQHKRSEQWQKHIIPSMVTWLREERWIQILPEPARKLTPWEMARKLGYK